MPNPELWALVIALNGVTAAVCFGLYLSDLDYEPPAWIAGWWTFIYNQSQRLICWCARRSK